MSRIRIADLGSSAQTAGLDHKVSGRFQRVVSMSIPTGGVAQSAHVGSGTVLDMQFSNRDVDALQPGAPEAASLGNQGSDLVLNLPVARRIRRVRLTNPQEDDRIAAFRFDGPVVSEDAVASRSHGSSGARLDVTDAALILRRRNGGESALNATDIEQVLVRYTPVNPRLSLRMAGDTQELALPTRTDADGLPVFPTSGAFGDDLAETLTRLLTAASSPLPDPLELELILSADQPCSAQITQLDLSLELETSALSEKAVLRFDGPVRRTQTVALTVPSGITFLGGGLSISVSGALENEQDQTEAGNDLPLAADDGLVVGPQNPIATKATLASAMALAEAECLLVAPDGPVDLRAVLYADADGRPGEARAESKPVELRSARPVAVTFVFTPQAVPEGPVWLGIETLTGSVVAFLEKTASGSAIARSTETGFALVADTGSRGLVCVLRAVARADAPQAGGPRLLLGDVALPALPANGAAEVDLATLASVFDAPGAVSLQISSAAKAVVTVAPVTLRYALAT